LQKDAAQTNIFQLSLIHLQLYLPTASGATNFRQEIKDALALKDPKVCLKKILFALLPLTKARLSTTIKQLFLKKITK
jgi:hypothetical protein